MRNEPAAVADRYGCYDVDVPRDAEIEAKPQHHWHPSRVMRCGAGHISIVPGVVVR